VPLPLTTILLLVADQEERPTVLGYHAAHALQIVEMHTCGYGYSIINRYVVAVAVFEGEKKLPGLFMHIKQDQT
jgi:hypothetical protein|tara:strand:+ start:287 stop:508 length:222 start_codon:yes stop_codon:yes gene_type:complete